MLAGPALAHLFARGLGDLLTLHVVDGQVLLGNLLPEKGRVVLKDRGFMTGVSAGQIATAFESGALGAVCDLPAQEWVSLSFLGARHCHLPVDLSATRTGLLQSSRNRHGDALHDFRGSVYRGFQLMLDSHFLPVVSLKAVGTELGVTGLTVYDLRLASIDLDAVAAINDYVRRAIDRHLTLAVEDVSVTRDDFERLFGSYLKRDGG